MLHPQTQALLDLIEARGIPPTHTLTPTEARAFYRERRAFTQPAPPPVALVRDLQADGPHGAIREHQRADGTDAQRGFTAAAFRDFPQHGLRESPLAQFVRRQRFMHHRHGQVSTRQQA